MSMFRSNLHTQDVQYLSKNFDKVEQKKIYEINP